MRSFLLIYFLLNSLCSALPTDVASEVLQRDAASGYGDTSATLRADLDSKWYVEFDNQKSNSQKPADPSSFYHCPKSGEVADLPKIEDWLKWEDHWPIAEKVMTKKNGGSQYNSFIKTYIQTVSKKTKIDARLILSLMMQESDGEIKVKCTPENSPTDCGLLQFHGGRSFDSSDAEGSIKGMLNDGIFGVAANKINAAAKKGSPNGRPGFVQLFNGVSWIDKQYWGNPFYTVRIYNAGSIHSPDLLAETNDKFKPYPFDIASRLLGWNGDPAGCQASLKCKYPPRSACEA